MLKDFPFLFTRGMIAGVMAYLFISGFFIAYHAVRGGAEFKFVLVGICIGVCAARIYFAAIKQLIDYMKEKLRERGL